MKNLLSPKWLLIINTFPVIVLLVLLNQQYIIIRSLLEDDIISKWVIFSSVLAGLGFITLIYSIYLIIKQKKISLWFALFLLVTNISFVYVYATYADDLISRNIPNWLVTDDVLLYVGTFLMPTIIYALFAIVMHFTKQDKSHNALVNFAITIFIPIFFYLLTQLILPLWKPYLPEFEIHTILILIIVVTLFFFFFLIRSIIILIYQKSKIWNKYQLLWKIPFAIIFPILGLSTNNSGLSSFRLFSNSEAGIFGDFSSIWFYAFALLNGILVCLPSLNNKMYRLVLFLLRSIAFSFILYFFFVFLPFLPISVIAIIAFGAGFLMLTPLILLIIQTNQLYTDFKYLKAFFSNRILLAASFAFFLFIPIGITVNFLNDKYVLNQALNYVYHPNYAKHYKVNKAALAQTIKSIDQQKSKNYKLLFVSKIPYITTYYNWLVFDNLTISEAKLNTLSQVFFGTNRLYYNADNISETFNVKITNISTNSVFDESQQAWKSWINLELTNYDDSFRFAEYATTFNLPDGCWISDYYLYVGDRKEYGILAEKKSALWVFSNIRNENRDPGILYYLNGNKIAFKVFPFLGDEVRKTGIEFLHKDPVTLTIDNNLITLGDSTKVSKIEHKTQNAIYVSAQQKLDLKKVKRKPNYHFLVDVSVNADAKINDFISRIENVLNQNPSWKSNAKISFVNAYTETLPITADWKSKLKNKTFEGGFYLERAMNTALFDAYKTNSNAKIIVVTDSISKAIVNNNFADFSFAFPENDLFYNLDSFGELQKHSLTHNPIEPLAQSLQNSEINETVLAYQLPNKQVVYLPNNNEPSIVLIDSLSLDKFDIKEKNWETGLLLQAQKYDQILNPELAEKQWLDMVKFSFISKIMVPETSYLVVENDAQKAILKAKQKQVLSGKKSADLDEEVQAMSEPYFWLLLVLFGLFVWYKEKKMGKQIKT